MKVLAIALSAPLLLIGAAYPDKPGSGGAGLHPAEEAMAGPVTYRPCRPGPGDDRCIQLYERGVRASYARWLRQRGVEEAPVQVAMGGPVEPGPRPTHSHRRPHADAAPRHESADHAEDGGHDARCVETQGRGETRGM